MAFELFRTTDAFPGIAASACAAGQAMQLSASAVERQFIPIGGASGGGGTSNIEPFGISLATAATFGLAVPVVDALNTVKVTAGASTGAGADIGVASVNGTLAPV